MYFLGLTGSSDSILPFSQFERIGENAHKSDFAACLCSDFIWKCQFGQIFVENMEK